VISRARWLVVRCGTGDRREKQSGNCKEMVYGRKTSRAEQQDLENRYKSRMITD
jgi:hypothetical protein